MRARPLRHKEERSLRSLCGAWHDKQRLSQASGKPGMVSDMSGGCPLAGSRGPDELLKPTRQACTNMHPVHSLKGARAPRMALCSAPAVCPP